MTVQYPSAMDFTELYKQSLSLCTFSPSSHLLATTVQYRLVIRDSQSLQILHLFNFPDPIEYIEWSPDSEYILATSFKTNLVWCWSVAEGMEEWSCKIEDKVAGIKGVKWGKDCRSIICWSDFQLRVGIWSLITKEVYWIQYPKYHDRGFSFRKDGRYLSVLESKDCKDSVSIIDCEDWSLIRRFQLETIDTDDISWSPDGKFIAVWDSIIEYKVVIYHVDGSIAGKYTASDPGLGIKSVTWSPSGQLLAVAGFDQKIRLLNNYTFFPFMTFSHTSSTRTDLVALKEVDPRKSQEDYLLQSELPPGRYELITPPFNVPAVRPDFEKSMPKIGVGICKFNCTGRMIVSRNDNMPNCLWVWDVLNLNQIGYIQQILPVNCVEWNPVEPDILAFSSGNGSVYIWGGDQYGCEAFEVPAVNFTVVSLRWNSDGKSLVLMDKDKFCVAFPIE